jgi:hypothetical protein
MTAKTISDAKRSVAASKATRWRTYRSIAAS